MDEAARVYGGKRKMARAFRITNAELDRWFPTGYVWKPHHLGFIVGLEARGAVPSPKLFGLASWKDLAGV
jgi:hypothetical protein